VRWRNTIPVFCRTIAWLAFHSLVMLFPRQSANPGKGDALMRRLLKWSIVVMSFTLVALVAAPTGASAGAGRAAVPNAFPAFCPDGMYCYTSAMQPLNGAGLNAHAYIYFHNHDDHSYTIDGVRVVNSNRAQTCSMTWALTNRPDGPAISLPDFDGAYPCANGVVQSVVSFGLSHGVSGRDGVVEVELFNQLEGNGDFTYHSLSTNDFGSGAHTCQQAQPAKPNRVRCGDF
jgi:hypothetical protein